MEKVNGANRYILIAILLTLLIHILISLIFYLKSPQENPFFFDPTKETIQDSQEDMNVFYEPPQMEPEAQAQREQPNNYYNIANTEIGEPELTEIPELMYVPKMVKEKTSEPEQVVQKVEEAVHEEEQQEIDSTENLINLAKVDSEYALFAQTSAVQEDIPNIPEQKTKKLLSGLQLLRGFQQFQNEEMKAQLAQEQNQNIEAEHATITAKINGEFQAALNSRSLSIPISMESKTDQEELYIDKDINTTVVIDIIFGEGGKVLDVEFLKSTGVKAADQRLKKWIFAVSPIARYAKYYKGAPFRIKMPIQANLPKGKSRAMFHVAG